MFDVIEVEIPSRKVICFAALSKAKKNAEVIVDFAVMHRDVEGSFYTAVEAGKYKIGDTYD